jgi:hypothetical protein
MYEGRYPPAGRREVLVFLALAGLEAAASFVIDTDRPVFYTALIGGFAASELTKFRLRRLERKYESETGKKAP